MQHIKEDGSSVNYFVSGAGHLIDSSTEHEVSCVIPESLFIVYIISSVG